MKISTDFIIESELGLQSINVTIEVNAEEWSGRNSVDKLQPFMKALREHRPFPTYQVINVSQTVIDGQQ